jgi:hypothetical protein
MITFTGPTASQGEPAFKARWVDLGCPQRVYPCLSKFVLLNERIRKVRQHGGAVRAERQGMEEARFRVSKIARAETGKACGKALARRGSRFWRRWLWIWSRGILRY